METVFAKVNSIKVCRFFHPYVRVCDYAAFKINILPNILSESTRFEYENWVFHSEALIELCEQLIYTTFSFIFERINGANATHSNTWTAA